MQMTKSMHSSGKIPTSGSRERSVSFRYPTSATTAKPKPQDENNAAAEQQQPKPKEEPCTAPPSSTTNNAVSSSTKRKKKKKQKSKAVAADESSHWLVNSSRGSSSNAKKSSDEFWSNASNVEERQNIREFWLQLGEEERRSLVKVEKEAVLRKMKEQQKHSCNCSVCGKKRTAIEDELEVLYDAYYEELEQYANHQQQTRLYSGKSEITEGDDTSDTGHENGNDLFDDDDDDYDDDDDGASRSDDQSDAASDDGDAPHFPVTYTANTSSCLDQFNFGSSLTVKGGILTVADDLLKNDGRKFLDMMERLAERRMQKEEEALEQADEYYDEVDEDEDEAYEDEEEEDGPTNEQRMEEGRRMFQVFAARMFEQRVLAAYREKVARERQQRLIQELEEEDRLRQERELKKQREKERKKDKKRQLKKQKEEERLAKEAQRKAEEEAARLERERKLEEERQRREQERLKKEEERRQREEERIRKEEEKRRRLKEERERVAEKERKRKEKEEKERREREEKERKEREEKERQEKERREREEKARKEREEKERREREEQERKRKEEEEKARAAKRKAEEERLAKEAEERERKQQQQQSKIIITETSKTSSTSPVVSSGVSATRPMDETARQKSLMDALVGGSSTTPLGPFLGNEYKQTPPPPPPPPAEQPHPLLPLNFMSPIGSNRLAEPATSPTAGYAPLLSPTDRGILPVGYNRIPPFDTPGVGLGEASSSKVISRTSATSNIAPIGQPLSSGGGRRSSSANNAGPIGSPVGSRAGRLMSADESSSSGKSSGKRPLGPGEGDTANSFFSNFLFGEKAATTAKPEQRANKPIERRFSLESASAGWTNGWTASTALSDNVHGRLFGDVLADRTTTILERARAAYHKLDEITQTKYFMSPSQFHTLVQLHRMLCDMYYDSHVDIRELYDVINSPMSGFQCINHAHHGYIVRYDPALRSTRAAAAAVALRPSSNTPPHHPFFPPPTSPPSLPTNSLHIATTSPPLNNPHPKGSGQQQLFGSMS